MASQQPEVAVVAKGDQPLSGSHPSTGQDVSDDCPQQRSEETIDIQQPVENGFLIKPDGQTSPTASFTYAFSPLTTDAAPMDWKLLVTENVGCQNIRCYELQAGDKLQELITGFQETNAKAVVLINTSDDYFLHPSIWTETKKTSFPVLVLTKSDGMKLLNVVDRHKENMLAKISVESIVDRPMQTKKAENGSSSVPQEQDEKSPFNLKTQLKKLIFDGGKPQVICEDPTTFTMVMSTFTQYEKYAKSDSSHIDALRKINRHLTQTFDQDFPLHLVLAYKIHKKSDIYKCDERDVFIRNCIEKVESMDSRRVASTFMGFLQRGDFDVQFDSNNSTSTFQLLQEACFKMCRISNSIMQKKASAAKQSEQHLYQRFVYSRFMWVSLYLRLEKECGTENTENLWNCEVIKAIAHLQMESWVVAEVKEGLDFGQQVELTSNLTFSPLLLAKLFASEGYVRPFCHLSHYICALEPYISQEKDYIFFVAAMRAEYEDWLKQHGQKKFSAISVQKTLKGTIQEGLRFVDDLYKFCTEHSFKFEGFDPECKKWVLLLLQLVDVTKEHPEVHLQSFLGRSTLMVVKKYRDDITKHVIDHTYANFSRLSMQRFFPLYKTFLIWPSKFLEDYLHQYQVPLGVRISDATWKELFSEVVKRFSGAQNHHYLLDFLESVAQCYDKDGRAGDLVVDFLKLKVPKLFAVEGRGEKDENVRHKFSGFLKNYIFRCKLKRTIIEEMKKILDAISNQRDEFQQLVLMVVEEEVVPDFQTPQEGSISSSPMYSVLQLIVTTLCKDTSWLQAPSMKQQFCWGIVTSCCGKIPITKEHFMWAYLYNSAITCLAGIYNLYCKWKGKTLSAEGCSQDIAHISSDNIRKYFTWINHVQAVLSEWHQRFNEQQVNYDEILFYASHQLKLEKLRQTICASSPTVKDIQSMKSMFLTDFEELNVLLIKYIPRKADTKWCTLLSLLQDWGVALPSHLLDPIEQHVVLPGRGKAGELLETPLPPNTSGRFKPPGQDISLKLTKAFTLHNLSKVVKGLQGFLLPLLDVLDMLIFFKLYPSKIFNEYLQFYLKKECEAEVKEKCSVMESEELEQHNTATIPASLHSPLPTLPSATMQSHPDDQSSVQGIPLDVLRRAMDCTRDLIVKLMKGTAAYSDITAKGKLNLQKLDVKQEWNTLHRSAMHFKLPVGSYEGLDSVDSVRSMLELFQYIHHIQTIHNVCEQYQLQGCLRDRHLVELCELVEKLSSEESRAKLTLLEASTNMKRVRYLLCQASPSSLELFTAVGDSNAFYQFVHEKQFVGEKGQAVFQQQYQLITAQLQHEEYNETVLNHLYAAFKIIEPFMDRDQSFYKLMSQVARLDVTNGLKQLKTVNTNITLIQLWFSRIEGDTLENVAKELDCIIATGNYLFQTPDTSSRGAELILEYSPSQQFIPTSLSQPPNQEDPELGMNKQRWNTEQIGDFVRKLGFLDTEKEGGDKIKHFLHVNETAYKLLNLSVHLRELGHPAYIERMVKIFLNCAITREEADQKVQDTETVLTTWMQSVDKLRNKYDWLLFFSLPKLLLLYHLLRAEDPNLEAIMHEISFLCSNEQAAWKGARVGVEKSLRSCTELDKFPMRVVGTFLGMVFNNHSLPKRCGENVSRHSSSDPTQLLHYCPRYSQLQLICLIISIYNGVPEAFEVFHCHPSSTEEEICLFLKRVAKHPLQYLILEVNLLPFRLQECLMQLHLVTWKREMEISSKKTPCLHFIETAPSVLRKIPSVVIKEHVASGPSLNFEEAQKVCQPQVVNPKDFACVQLVYGHAGDGKTHYIQQQLACSPARLTIAVNEAFTPLNAISKLRTLPLNQKNCAIFFNFTMLPPGESVDESERVHHQQLMEVIGWFFFYLLMLGYVEDSDTGLSFRIPGGLAWAVYVEVPSHHHSTTPEEVLEHFKKEVPTLGLLGTPHYIHPNTPYCVDWEVQLVCKYLKALQVGDIDKLYHNQEYLQEPPVKFSTEPDLPEEECQQLLLQYMPEHVRNTKITQRLFIKYMNRRCRFLDNMPAFNYNPGVGEYITDEQGKRVRTDTKQLGSTLMKTMLREVEDFCDPAIKENWSLKPHQQLIYDFKDGGGSFGLISLHPEKLSEQDRMKFKKIGVEIPSMDELYSRELLDMYLSRALNVELENGRLTAIDDSAYVLTMDYTIKMLNIHERYHCGVPVIIEGETGVGKTALLEMLSTLWNHALLMQWKKQYSQMLDVMKRKLGAISKDVCDNYQLCVNVMERLVAGQDITKEDLVLLGQLPDPIHDRGQFYSQLRSGLLSMKSDPVITLLILPESQQQEASPEQLFKRAETENSAESTASLLYGVMNAQIKPTFHKLNVHAAMTPDDISNLLEPVFAQAKKLQEVFMNNVVDKSNHALQMKWKKQYSQMLDVMKRKLGAISKNVSGNYQVCVNVMEKLVAGQDITKEDLVLLGQLPDPIHDRGQFYSQLRSGLLSMKSDPVITFLIKQQEASLEQLFERAETENSAESTANLLYGVMNAKIKPTFHKQNLHAAMTPDDIWNHLEPVFAQDKKLQEAFMTNVADTSTLRVPFVTVFLDEVNTSSCLGLFKEIIVDRTFDGNSIPENVFVVAACNPHRGNSLSSHSPKDTWVRGSYYVRQLHPTLHFLMWDYGSLDNDQERAYVNAKMKMLNKEMPNVEVASLTDLIVTSQKLMRDYAFNQLCTSGMDEHQAKLSSRSCVSQRDIQRVFTFYQWVKASYTMYQPHGLHPDYSRRAVLVALGIVYYMRLNSHYRKEYEKDLGKQGRLSNDATFSQAFSEELNWYINQVELPVGIAKTQALKENIFATIVCTVTHTPLIIVGAPGSSKTLSFNLTIANLKGQESKMKLFRDITVFRSLDPHFYQCSRRTTSNEIQTVFCRAINRQRSHIKFKLPIYCVVFMDEAGLPEESHESLKVLHYYLDQQEVSFVAITNHVLDAAKTNRAVSLFRSEEEDLETLAKGCFCNTSDEPPPELKKDLTTVEQFCPAFSRLMKNQEFRLHFGLRDFIHFVSYLRRQRDHNRVLTPQLVMEALERNFNGSDNFNEICNEFLKMIQSSTDKLWRRGILEVLRDSLEDRPQQQGQDMAEAEMLRDSLEDRPQQQGQDMAEAEVLRNSLENRPQQQGQDMAEAEVRYKLIIDPSEDDSLVRLLFSFGVLQRKETRMFVCSDFSGDSQLQKINTIAAIRHSAIEGHTVLMTQTDGIHESFYDLFNQRFRRIDDPKGGTRYYTNIAIGAHMKPSRVNPNFQCVVVVKKSEVKNTPAPFLNRFEKYCITHHSLLEEALSNLPPCIRIIVEAAMEKVQDFIDRVSGPSSLYGLRSETLNSMVLSLISPLTTSYESLKEPSVNTESLNMYSVTVQPPKEPTVTVQPPKECTVTVQPPKERTVTVQPPKEPTVTVQPPKERTVTVQPPKEPTVTVQPPKEPTVTVQPPKEPTVTVQPPKEPTVNVQPPKEPTVTVQPPKEPTVTVQPPKEPTVTVQPPKEPTVTVQPPKEPTVTVQPPKEPTVTVQPPKEPTVTVQPPKEPTVNVQPPKEPTVTVQPPKEPTVTVQPPKEPTVTVQPPKEPTVTVQPPKEPTVTVQPPKEPTVTVQPPKEPTVTVQPPKEPTVTVQPPKEPTVTDLKVLLMEKLLQSLKRYFHILPYSVGELHLDSKYVFDLVLRDPEFEGLLPNLSQSAAVQAVAEAMRVLHSAPAPQDGATQLSTEGCLMVALLQQWLVRYLCKRLMQLMTSEAFILHRNVLPSSYLENYISFQTHFSLQDLILKYYHALEHTGWSPASLPTKLLCFTRSSPLIHQLPPQFSSSVFEAQPFDIVQRIFSDLVSPNPSQLVLYKLSSIHSQNSMQEMLREFIQSNTAKVCLLVVNMQETSCQVVNHIRILIEEAEMLLTQQAKLFIMLLHFSPTQFFDPCYPSLFLKGWDHCYLDTVTDCAGQGVVDIRDWFRQCCFREEALQSPEKDSLVLALKKILPEAIPVILSRVVFGTNQQRSFNQPMNGSQRSEALRELLFEKKVGQILCERFRSYWNPKVMTEYLEKAATFTKNHESTLNITDTIQTNFRSLFFDFLVCMLSQINEEFNIDILFDSDCTPDVEDLFLGILQVFPLPKLSQLKVLSTSLPAPTSNYLTRFPFFKVVCETVERIVEQGHEETNKQLNLIQGEEAESTISTSCDICDNSKVYTVLHEVVSKKIEEKMKTTPKDGLVLAVEAMELYYGLWHHYLVDLLVHKLRLGGHQGGGAISQQILCVFFKQLDKQEEISRVVSLHCYVHIYQLDLARMANILRPLNQMQQAVKAESNLLFLKMKPSQQLVSSMYQTQNLLTSPKHIAVLVVNTLFSAIMGSTCGKDPTVPEKMKLWFKAYRDMMTVSTLKQDIYMALDPQRKEEGSVRKEVEVVEARLNMMQAVFLAIQASASLGEDILLKGQKIFQTLFDNHFTETLELKGPHPRLAEVVSVVVKVISATNSKTYSIRFLLEGFFAHFFSPYRQGYLMKDVQWFLELANKQEQWGANYGQHVHHKQVTKPEIFQEAVSICVFKHYLGRILGSCDHKSALSGPFQLCHHESRSQIGSVLMVTSNLGSSAPYIPTYYQECSTTANHVNHRMQQPLAHLYFLTLLEHLQAKECKLSNLIRTAIAIKKECDSTTTGEIERVVLWVELQAVLQVILQELATHLNPSDLHMGEVHPLKEDINKLLDSTETGGGDTQGHGMVLALHMMKQLKSSQKFSELLTIKYDSICRWLHCLKPVREQLISSLEPKLYLFPFMLPSKHRTELGDLYSRVKRVMLDVHNDREMVDDLVHIADECTQSVKRRGDSPSYMGNDGKGSTVDKKYCFRMMVWLCAYYEFYDKKVISEPLCKVMEDQLAPYLGEKGCIRLIQCFLNPQLMLRHPEPPKPLWEQVPWVRQRHRVERDGKKIDHLFELFTNQQIEQSDRDLRHSLANLVGAVLGCPPNSNHLWYHLFHPEQLPGTYMTGYMYNFEIGHGGFCYDFGVELSADGQYGRQDYVKHATRGTYTLHSLYLLLWANFGTLCMALLTQPEAKAAIHGPIISSWQSVKHYCVSQLRTIWTHMQNNLHLLNEERSFLVMCCTKRLYEMFMSGNTALDYPQGIFQTCHELDRYEKMWHNCIYQPSLNELKTEYSQLWLNKLFIDIRHLGLCYPHFPSEQDFTHSILSSEDIQNHAQGEDFHLLARFAQEWPRLQAGGLLLPDLVEFYQWLHTALAHLVTNERAATLPIGRVVELAVRRCNKERGDHLKALYKKVEDGYNQYVKLIGGAIGAGACAALRQENKIDTIDDDTPLLHFLSDSADEEEGNDCLYTMAAGIIAAHNAFIKGLYSTVQAQQQSSLACLLPDEPAKVYPSEVNDSHSIVGKFRSLYGISDFMQLVRSRYQLPSIDGSMEQHMSPGLLQTVQAPEFSLSLLQEDIVAYFLAGKPLICIEPSSLLRTPFKFHKPPEYAEDFVGSVLNVDDIAEKISETFKAPMEDVLQKQLEYEFHSASYHTMVEVVTGLRIVAGHLVKAVMEQNSAGLEQKTVPQFMLMLYGHDKESSAVLKEIGVCSTSHSQLVCLIKLPLSSLLYCLQLFASWVRDGVYDFAALPLGLKNHLCSQDLQSIEQIPLKWTGTPGDLLTEIKQMNDVLKHSEARITKTANESANKPLMQYLQEIHHLRIEDRLPSYMPPSILIQHYVYFRIALRRLALTVQQQVKAEADNGDTEKEQWREGVNDLWENKLSHLREEIIGPFVYDPQTGRYGFQEGSEYDSEEELMDDLMNEVEGEDRAPKGDGEDPDHHVTSVSTHSLSYNQEFYNDGGFVYDPQTGRYGFQEGLDYDSEEELTDDFVNKEEDRLSKGDAEESFIVISEGQIPSVEFDTGEKEEGTGHAGRVKESDEVEGLAHMLYKDPEFRKMAKEYRDTQTLEQSAQDCTPDHVGQFLEMIGLGHHVATFIEQEISGDILLEADQEMLEELGVTSAIERLKIKVLFQRSLQGGEAQYPLESVLDFLEQNKLSKYSAIFQESGIDGDLLLEADDNVLKELGVSSAVDRKKIMVKYKTFVKSQL